MDSIGELEFKVQILARCLGSALQLGRPTHIEIHYASPQVSDLSCSRRDTLGLPGTGISPERMTSSQGRALASVA
ncbi:MAG: hypothetical protein Q6J46_10080 [Thermostichus sp. DG02_2_bins_29]